MGIVRCFCVPDSQMTRKTPPSYSDGVYMMVGENRPSPRTLSTRFMKGQDGLSSVKNRTALLAFFGKYYIIVKFNLTNLGLASLLLELL